MFQTKVKKYRVIKYKNTERLKWNNTLRLRIDQILGKSYTLYLWAFFPNDSDWPSKDLKQSVQNHQEQISPGDVINISGTLLHYRRILLLCDKAISNMPKNVRHSVVLMYFDLKCLPSVPKPYSRVKKSSPKEFSIRLNINSLFSIYTE